MTRERDRGPRLRTPTESYKGLRRSQATTRGWWTRDTRTERGMIQQVEHHQIGRVMRMEW